MAFLIDLEKVYDQKEESGCAGLKDLVEKSIRRVFCRHCEDAPCVLSCPQTALKRVRTAEGGSAPEADAPPGHASIREDLQRSNFLCVGCRTCLMGCPFGVNIDEMVEYRRLPSPGLEDVAAQCPWVERGEFEESEDIVRIEQDVFVRAVNWKKQLGLRAV